MGEALVQKGTKVTKVRATDTAQEEVTTLERQLEGIRHTYEGLVSVVTWVTLPGQHPMMERDFLAG